MSGRILEREKRNLCARRTFKPVSHVGAGEEKRSTVNLGISDLGAVRQLKEDSQERSKIPGKARWHISWIEALLEPSSDLLK